MAAWRELKWHSEDGPAHRWRAPWSWMMLAEKWSISCCVSKQACHRYQRCQPSRASRKENTCGIWLVSAAELRKWKTQDTAPQLPRSWDAYEKNDFSKPRPLQLPIHTKVLNSLTWGICFSLINTNLSLFQQPDLYYKTPIYPESLPYFFGAVS